MQSSALARAGSRVSATEPEKRTQGNLQSQSDEDLLRLCASGETMALEELVRRYQSPIHRYLVRFMGSNDDAEEATLDVFVRAWQHAGRFQYRAHVATWLYRIAVNIARDAHSRRKARPLESWPDERELAHMTMGNTEDDALRSLERKERAQALERALQRLGESDRMLLVLYYLEERDYEEIQAITKLSYTVLKTRLARARRRLRTLLDAGNKEAKL